MKKIKLYHISCSILVTGLLTFSSCEKSIQVDPRQSIDIVTALNTSGNIDAAVIGVYSRLKSLRTYGRDNTLFGDALADNGRFTNRSGRFANEARNLPNAHYNNWGTYYVGINEINLILEAIPNLVTVPAVTQAQKDLWEGQLKFLRALFYFDLAKEYAYIPGAVVSALDKGGIPILTQGVNTIDEALLVLPSRAPISEAYQLIVSDLKEAETKLGNLGISPALASKQAAQALLARVYLYTKDYQGAKSYADLVISFSGSKLMNTGSYVSGWRNKVNPESIFEVTFTINAENNGVNESLQTSLTTLVVSGNRAQTAGFGDLVPTTTLLADLGITVTNNGTATAAITARSTDVRNQLYELGTAGRGAPVVECTKYLGKNGFVNLDNAIVLRISEMYLIRAEAQATVGSSVFNQIAAIADLVTIKRNRYTDYVGSSQSITDQFLTGTNLFNEIFRQKRIEYAFEGHRFFDLKRLGLDIPKLPHSNDVLFTSYLILPPLPQSELDGNKNLVQNSGY
jgi:hypothetical protein